MAAEFEDLVTSGKLPVGTKLTRVYKGAKKTAIVMLHDERPALKVGREFYGSPSLGAKAAADGMSLNGWIWWRLPDGEPLASIRRKPSGRSS
jgi:hypothetical protein